MRADSSVNLALSPGVVGVHGYQDWWPGPLIAERAAVQEMVSPCVALKCVISHTMLTKFPKYKSSEIGTWGSEGLKWERELLNWRKKKTQPQWLP